MLYPEGGGRTRNPTRTRQPKPAHVKLASRPSGISGAAIGNMWRLFYFYRTMRFMMFTHDPDSSTTNRQERGVDFDEAQALRDCLIEVPANVIGKPRFPAVGMIWVRHWTATQTYLGGLGPAISVSRARKKEIDRHKGDRIRRTTRRGRRYVRPCRSDKGPTSRHRGHASGRGLPDPGRRRLGPACAEVRHEPSGADQDIGRGTPGAMMDGLAREKPDIALQTGSGTTRTGPYRKYRSVPDRHPGL